MDFPMTDAALNQLVEELATALTDIAKKEAVAGEKLAKAEESSSPEASKKEESSMAKEESAPPAEESASGSAPADAPPAPSPEPSPSPAGDAPPADPAADAAAGGDAPPSPEELMEMYKQLPPDQLKAHLDAAQAAAAAMGLDAGAGAPPPPAPEAPPPAAPPPGPSASPAPDMAMKYEAKIKELEEKLTKSVEAQEHVVGLLEKIAVPERKAVTGITWHKFVPAQPEQPIRKSVKEMDEKEIKTNLRELVKNPKLTKAEREMVNDYYLKPGSVKIDQLQKLFDRVN